MAWTPDLRVANVAMLTKNLLAFIVANQQDATAWATGNGSLPKYALVFNSPTGRIWTQYPVLTVVSKRIREAFNSDDFTVEFELIIEQVVTGSDADALTLTIEQYAEALESMLANIPQTSLMANISSEIRTDIAEIETTYFPLGSNGTTLAQMSETRVVYLLYESAYE